MFAATVLAALSGLTAVTAAPAGGIEEPGLAKRDYSTSYANELVDGTPCRAVTVIYARGTGQQGNIGQATDVGPLFLDNLADLVGANNLAAQGVDYAADVGGFSQGGDPAGSALMAELTAQAKSQCPDTQLVLSGYSQGGQLVHNAADQISSQVTNFVAAVLIFGDPNNGTAVGNVPDDKVNVICHAGDGICKHTSIITPAHLNYQDDAPDAAQWVADFLGY